MAGEYLNHPDDLSRNHGLILMGQRFNLCGLIYERPVCLYDSSNFNNCRIGAYTYLGANADCTNLGIGRYCSIAGNLKAGLGSHSMEWFTTFPFTASGNPFGCFTSYRTLEQKWNIATNKYNYQPRQIYIENDVWIGQCVLFPASKEITVGSGAIIGANSVVTKDVPAYCIVAGNPAKIVRQRFPDEIIADLLATKWWNYDLPACFTKHKNLVDSKFVREAPNFLQWWKNGGKEFVQRFPLSHEWRKITTYKGAVDIKLLRDCPARDNF